jgi:hypothetical protein
MEQMVGQATAHRLATELSRGAHPLRHRLRKAARHRGEIGSIRGAIGVRRRLLRGCSWCPQSQLQHERGSQQHLREPQCYTLYSNWAASDSARSVR